MYQIDPTKTAQQNLIALINSGSTVVFTGTEFSVGAPTEYVPTPPEVTNTVIHLEALEGTGYMGTRDPRYIRLTVGDTRPGAFADWVVTSATTRAELIADIIENHKLVESDVVFSGLEGGMPAAGAGDTLTCSALDGSYLYIGTVIFNVTNSDLPG